MANNYLQFAEEFLFPKAAAEDVMSIAGTDYDDFPQWFVDKHRLTEENVDDFLEEHDAKSLGVYTDYDEKHETLYVCAEEYGNIEGIAWILSQVMDHYQLKTPIILQGAYSCSKMRPSEFGGVVCVAGPDIVLSNDTNFMGDSLAKEILTTGGDAKTYSHNEFLEAAQCLWEAVLETRTGDPASSIPELDELFERMGTNSVRAACRQKAILTAMLQGYDSLHTEDSFDWESTPAFLRSCINMSDFSLHEDWITRLNAAVPTENIKVTNPQ